MDRLFLPGNMYVSLTHTIPSSKLALSLDELELDDGETPAEQVTKLDNNKKKQLHIRSQDEDSIKQLPATVAGTAVTVAPPGMTGRRLLC